MRSDRQYSLIDKFCLGLDQVVRALTDNVKTTGALYPAKNIAEADLDESERKQAAALIRINHAGEICAQALYHGQGLVSRTSAVQENMQQAAIEEGDHLTWCKLRLDELGSHTSYLNPIWYSGSFCIGMIAGIIGDKWSLGFVAETEQQVIKHLESHLNLLPAKDLRSHEIVAKMRADEAKHRDEALASGAHELPWFIKQAMAFTAKIMVKTAYWI